MKNLIDFIIESSDQKIYTNMIVISPDDKILILRRANYMKKFGGKWGFPGGSFDKKDKDSKRKKADESPLFSCYSQDLAIY